MQYMHSEVKWNICGCSQIGTGHQLAGNAFLKRVKTPYCGVVALEAKKYEWILSLALRSGIDMSSTYEIVVESLLVCMHAFYW